MQPHEAALKAALRSGEQISRVIGSLGSAEHPQGAILVAYRAANRGLREAVRTPGATRAAAETFAELRRSVREMALRSLATAQAIGIAQAQAQAAANGVLTQQYPPALLAMAVPATDGALSAWLNTVDAQTAAATAQLTLGDTDAMLGDDERAGTLRPAPVIAEGARWLASVAAAAATGVLGWIIERSGGTRDQWVHQAVAGIDERTTDCCLRVHGQTQPLDTPFVLTGTPRYADHLAHPPFHWYCRSAEAVVRRDLVSDDLTAQMIEAARSELLARGPDGKQRVEIHPADSRSKRRP